MCVLENSSIRSSASKTSARGPKPADTLPTSMSSLSIQNATNGTAATGDQEHVVVFLVRLSAEPSNNIVEGLIRNALPVQCEQVSHHPPISSAYYTCPSKGVEMTCVDQIAAKVSGMSKSCRSSISLVAM